MARLACGYDRVSTTRQAERADLNTRYLPAIQACCDRKGFQYVKLFTDAKSGKNANRPGLQDAMKWAVRNKGVIVFYDLSRFARSLIDAVQIAQELKAQGAGLCAATEAIDTSDDSPAAELTFHVLAACAQFQRRLIGAKVTVKNAAIVDEKGYRTMGEQPAGWKLVNGVRVPDPLELSIMRRCWKLKRKRTPQQVAVRLAAEGVPTISAIRNKRSGREWTEAMTRHLLKRKLPSRAPIPKAQGVG